MLTSSLGLRRDLRRLRPVGPQARGRHILRLDARRSSPAAAARLGFGRAAQEAAASGSAWRRWRRLAVPGSGGCGGAGRRWRRRSADGVGSGFGAGFGQRRRFFAPASARAAARRPPRPSAAVVMPLFSLGDVADLDEVDGNLLDVAGVERRRRRQARTRPTQSTPAWADCRNYEPAAHGSAIRPEFFSATSPMCLKPAPLIVPMTRMIVP